MRACRYCYPLHRNPALPLCWPPGARATAPALPGRDLGSFSEAAASKQGVVVGQHKNQRKEKVPSGSARARAQEWQKPEGAKRKLSGIDRSVVQVRVGDDLSEEQYNHFGRYLQKYAKCTEKTGKQYWSSMKKIVDDVEGQRFPGLKSGMLLNGSRVEECVSQNKTTYNNYTSALRRFQEYVRDVTEGRHRLSQVPDHEGGADRKRQRRNDGGKQVRAGGAGAIAKRNQAKGMGLKRSRLRERGVADVVEQRLRKDNGKEHYEYRCVWTGYEEADATWETEVTLKRVKHGAEKLVGAVLCLSSCFALLPFLPLFLSPAQCAAWYRMVVNPLG
jgi:hypothetical protein